VSTIEEYSGNQFVSVMMGTAGTAGDMVYMTTGSLKTLKSNSNSGTENTSTFVGVLVDSTIAGSLAAVNVKQASLDKITTSHEIEPGDVIYANGAASNNKVGTVVGGTAVGVCCKYSGTTAPRVSAILLPYYITGAVGFAVGTQ
jgi:hypothetical protein